MPAQSHKQRHYIDLFHRSMKKGEGCQKDGGRKKRFNGKFLKEKIVKKKKKNYRKI